MSLSNLFRLCVSYISAIFTINKHCVILGMVTQRPTDVSIIKCSHVSVNGAECIRKSWYCRVCSFTRQTQPYNKVNVRPVIITIFFIEWKSAYARVQVWCLSAVNNHTMYEPNWSAPRDTSSKWFKCTSPKGRYAAITLGAKLSQERFGSAIVSAQLKAQVASLSVW